MRVDPAVEAEAIASVTAWRTARDEQAAATALEHLRATALDGTNLMPPSIECARAGVTTGEWAQVLRDCFGEYRAPTGVGALTPTTTREGMEQARELAASEASPDWYARGQEWGLADALTNGQSGDWVLDDIARAFSAGAQAGAAVDQHTIKRMQAALAENASRSANYLRKAIKWEARAAELATDAQRYRILRNCNMDVRNRLEHYGGDALDERLDALNSLALGPNVEAKRALPVQELE